MNKEGWEIKKLGEVINLQNGFAFSSKLFTDNDADFPLIRIRDIKKNYTDTYYSGEYDNSFVVKKGDYLIGMDGDFNISQWNGYDALLNQRVCRINTKNENTNIQFVYYFLLICLQKIHNETAFVTVKHLSSTKLLSSFIPVPPLAIQEQIVAELDVLNDILAKKRQQLTELDTLAKASFYHLFGNPVENEKGWEVKRLEEISIIKTGSTPSRQKESIYYGGTIPWVKTTEVNGLEIKTTEEYITERALSETNLKIHPIHTILLAMYGQGKTRGQVGLLKIKATTNQACAAIIVNENVNYKFIYLFLKLNYEYIRSFSRGGNQENLNLSLIKAIPVILPPLALQNQFAEQIEAIEKQKELINQFITEVQKLLDYTMDKYFN